VQSFRHGLGPALPLRHYCCARVVWSVPTDILGGLPVITAVLGDITKQDVDAIVNAANNAMRGGGSIKSAFV
jgi:hypothetical protein